MLNIHKSYREAQLSPHRRWLLLCVLMLVLAACGRRNEEPTPSAAPAPAIDVPHLSKPQETNPDLTRLMVPSIQLETPIVALTAHALPDDIARFRETGMDDVLTKPLSRDRLVTVLSDLCDAPRPGAEAEEDDLEAILGAEQTVIVRQQALAELSAGLARLEALQAQGGAGEAIGQLAHKMAGTAAVVGFAAIHAELAALETLGSTGTVPKIGAAIGRVRGLLSEKGAS